MAERRDTGEWERIQKTRSRHQPVAEASRSRHDLVRGESVTADGTCRPVEAQKSRRAILCFGGRYHHYRRDATRWHVSDDTAPAA